MLLGASCSEGFIAGPDEADAVIETRATPTITVTCDPAPKGENQNYLGLKEIYRFRGGAKTMTSITVLENDDQGHFRLRIDQPGRYTLFTGLGGLHSASAYIAIYWRPEKVISSSICSIDADTGEKYTAMRLHYAIRTEMYTPHCPIGFIWNIRTTRFRFRETRNRR